MPLVDVAGGRDRARHAVSEIHDGPEQLRAQFATNRHGARRAVVRAGRRAGLGRSTTTRRQERSTMFSRVLSSAVAAAALVALPALASEPARDADARELPRCCERVAMQMGEHVRSEKADDASSARKEQKIEQHREQDPTVPTESWGG
jgi:hypothetical protein